MVIFTFMDRKQTTILIFGGVAFIALMGWLYQLSTASMCFPKLGFTFVGGLFFWILGNDVIAKLTRPSQDRKKWLKSVLLTCISLLILNQVLLYTFVRTAFDLAYECSINTSFIQFIQINHLLPNFLLFCCIYHDDFNNCL